MAKYKEGKFWESYTAASKSDRLKLLEENPQYNRRKDWTDDMWDADKKTKKAILVAKARGWGDFAVRQDAIKARSTISADKFLAGHKKLRRATKWG